jgi:hypothetical protein
VLGDQGASVHLVLDSVNRRGKAIECEVTIVRMRESAGGVQGVIC